MSEQVSKCCGAPMRVGGERSTHWYICTACDKSTDGVEPRVECDCHGSDPNCKACRGRGYRPATPKERARLA